MNFPSDDNPYQSTNATLTPDAAGSNDSAAREIVKAPAMILMTMHALSIATSLLLIILNLLKLGVGASRADSYGQSQDQAFMLMFQGTAGIIVQIISILVASFCIFACIKMMKLESKGIVWTMLIISVIPCCSPCCIGFAFAIWGIIVMNNPITKIAFKS